MKEIIRQFGAAIIAVVVFLIIIGIIFGEIYVSGSKKGLFGAISDEIETVNKQYSEQDTSNNELENIASTDIEVTFDEIQADKTYSLMDIVKINKDSNFDIYILEAFDQENNDVTNEVKDRDFVCFKQPGTYFLKVKVILDNGYNEITIGNLYVV